MPIQAPFSKQWDCDSDKPENVDVDNGKDDNDKDAVQVHGPRLHKPDLSKLQEQLTCLHVYMKSNIKVGSVESSFKIMNMTKHDH